MKRFVSALVLVTLAGLVYVYTEVEAVEIGYRIQKQEEAKMLCLDRQRALKYNIARMTSPGVMEKKLESERIVLESPKSWQTLVMSNQTAAVVNRPDMMSHFLNRPSLLTRFLIQTAQAEANES